ncbi:MAG: hypothetical protein LKF36_13640 [Lactobacillus sp.]|jgi:hypothetical protein|nr:hypothetical protein [Lactobacillus sp.]
MTKVVFKGNSNRFHGINRLWVIVGSNALIFGVQIGLSITTVQADIVTPSVNLTAAKTNDISSPLLSANGSAIVNKANAINLNIDPSKTNAVQNFTVRWVNAQTGEPESIRTYNLLDPDFTVASIYWQPLTYAVSDWSTATFSWHSDTTGDETLHLDEAGLTKIKASAQISANTDYTKLDVDQDQAATFKAASQAILATPFSDIKAWAKYYTMYLSEAAVTGAGSQGISNYDLTVKFYRVTIKMNTSLGNTIMNVPTGEVGTTVNIDVPQREGYTADKATISVILNPDGTATIPDDGVGGANYVTYNKTAPQEVTAVAKMYSNIDGGPEYRERNPGKYVSVRGLPGTTVMAEMTSYVGYTVNKAEVPVNIKADGTAEIPDAQEGGVNYVIYTPDRDPSIKYPVNINWVDKNTGKTINQDSYDMTDPNFSPDNVKTTLPGWKIDTAGAKMHFESLNYSEDQNISPDFMKDQHNYVDSLWNIEPNWTAIVKYMHEANDYAEKPTTDTSSWLKFVMQYTYYFRVWKVIDPWAHDTDTAWYPTTRYTLTIPVTPDSGTTPPAVTPTPVPTPSTPTPVIPAASQLTVHAAKGAVTTKHDLTRLYVYKLTNNGTGTITTTDNPDFTGDYIRDARTIVIIDQVAGYDQEVGGFHVVAYHISADNLDDKPNGFWVRAEDVLATMQYNYAENVTGSVLATTAAKTYSDINFNHETKALKVGAGQTFDYTQVIKESLHGQVVGYAHKTGDTWTFVKAADFQATTPAEQVTTAKLPTGTAVYSDQQAAAIYSDASTTKDTGTKLSTKVDEWSAFEVAKDADGQITAYRLGKDQWVKASAIQVEKDLAGTFNVAAGVTLRNSDNTLVGTIKTAGLYKVFAVRYINGKQALRLGNDSQWVYAAQGDYYPA